MAAAYAGNTIKGAVTVVDHLGNTEVYQDECFNSTTVIENVCYYTQSATDPSARYHMPCPTGKMCVDGACK